MQQRVGGNRVLIAAFSSRQLAFIDTRDEQRCPTKAKARMTKLVYIGGYGHSGSTLLAYLMTANPQVVVCGDVAGVRRAETKLRKCSCGQLAQSCPVWGPVQPMHRACGA